MVVFEAFFARFFLFFKGGGAPGARPPESTPGDRSVFIGGLGPVQKVVGHKLFYDEKLIEPKLFSIPSLIGQQLL